MKHYCMTCYTCMKKNQVTIKMKGSIKPIFSKNLRDRFQVDLIDFCKLRKRDPFGVLILVLKDHATGFAFICALPRKQASLVAYKLQELFGLIGYPKTFHTDNGKEFTAKTVHQFLCHLNPNIFAVTVWPRCPYFEHHIGSNKRSSQKSSHMKEFIEGKLSDLEGLSKDLCLLWDGKSADQFPPASKFLGKIDKAKNCHIQKDQIHLLPKIQCLVLAFEEHVPDITVDSIWLIKKTKQDNGVQEWHQDMKTKITKTMVVNVGAVDATIDKQDGSPDTWGRGVREFFQ